MIVLCCLLAALIASGPTHGQLTCDTVPQPVGNPCIEHNDTTQAIYAPLYPSDSTVIVVFRPGDDAEIDVRFDVEIYMDCSGLLMPPEGGGSTEEVYFLQTVGQTTQVVTAGEGRDVRDFLGANEEILRIRNVSFATGAVAGSQGRYHCYVCPMGTQSTVTAIEACGTNATVLVTVLQDLPQVCTGSNNDTLIFDRDEIEVKPGRDFVCITENPDTGSMGFAYIQNMTGSISNNLRFICRVADDLTVQGHIATASFNGQDIFVNDETVFPNTVLCPTDDVETEECGVYRLNDDLSIGLGDGIINSEIDVYYGVFTCTISVPNLDVTVSASVIASNCARPDIASEPPQADPSTGMVTIGNFACTGSTLNCPIAVSTGTPVNITWTINGVPEEFTSTAGAYISNITANTPGSYSCSATNAFGSDEASSAVVAPPTLLASAFLSLGTGNGCSRIVGGSAFDVCPALNEIIEFDCLYDTTVPPNVQFLGGDVRVYDDDGNEVQTLVAFTSPAQAGTYSCRAQTAVCGTLARQDLVVSVHDAPLIISSYTGLSATELSVTQVSVVGQNVITNIIEGDSIALLCPFTGIEQPTAQWMLDGSAVDDSNARITITQRTDQTDPSIQVSILTITNVMNSDNGNYACTASNNVIGGAAIASVSMTVVAGPQPVLTFTITDSNGQDVSTTSCARINPMPIGVDACPFVGERVVVNCFSSPEGLTVSLRVPPSGAVHPQNEIVAPSIQEGGNIPNGMYFCRSNGDVDSGTLQLYDPPRIFVNYTALTAADLEVTQVFVVGSSAVTNFIVGDSLALVCPFTGTIMPTVQWIHNGSAVDDTNPRITITQRTDQNDNSIQVSILNITNLMSSDTGSYRCTATNDAGVATETITLVEVEAPKPVLTFTITDRFRRDWSTTGCSRIDPTPANIDVCPFVGETVTVSCVSSPPGFDVSLVLPSGAVHTEDQIFSPSIQEGGNIPDGLYSCRLNGEVDSGTLRLYEPPSIVRNALLPTPPPTVPGGGEVTDVGQLHGEEVSVQPGENAILFFAFSGMDAAPSFFKLEGGMFVEITETTPGILILPATNGFFLVVANFSSSDSGTYQFVASNEAGTVSTTATLIEARENVWVASPWSACEPDCHKGERVRTVVCREMPGKVLQPDNECPAPKPPNVELCVNRGPCYLTPQWGHGDWSECSQPCGGGYRERDIFCIVPRTGALVPHSNCYVHSAPPNGFEHCNSQPCCVKDLYSDWCQLIRGTTFCAMRPYYDVYCCWTCSGSAVYQQ